MTAEKAWTRECNIEIYVAVHGDSVIDERES
jgi:hypothetical protein